MRCIRGLLVAAAFLGACGGGNAGGAAGDARQQGLRIAFGAPRFLAASAFFSRGLVVEAVYQATAASGAGMAGGITKTGTLQQNASGPIYDPSPSDKLVIVLGDTRHEIVIRDAAGDASAMNAAMWLAAPHRLSYTHVIPGLSESRVEIAFDGARFETKLAGHADLGGGRTEFDLAMHGGVQGGRDGQGADSTTQMQVSGTLRGAGFDVEVHEEQAMRYISSDIPSVLYSMRGNASRIESHVANVLRTGGAEYRFDVRATSDRAEKGGNLKNQENSASGTVVRDGQAFGTCSLDGGRPVLQTAEGAIDLSL